jgi:hypothetical protein
VQDADDAVAEEVDTEEQPQESVGKPLLERGSGT